MDFKLETELIDHPYRDEKTAAARKLYRKIAPSGENFVFSPLSIEAALHLLAISAQGDSYHAISNYLLLKDADPAHALAYIEDCFEYMSRPLEYMMDGFEAPLVKLASSLVSHRKLKLDQTKIASIKKQIDVHFAEYDFEKEAGLAKKDVNSWIEKQTRGKIKNLVGKINNNTLMILVNALYLKLAWEGGFPLESTKISEFKDEQGRPSFVDMMHKEDDLYYLKKTKYEAVQIPVNTYQLKVWMIRPEHSVKEVVREFSNVSLKKALSDARKVAVKLGLPKFKIENRLGLLNSLATLGLKRITERTHSELSGLYTTRENIFVGEIQQGNFFQLDENGIEAASASVVMMDKAEALEPPKPIDLKFDRPFVFLIYHGFTGRLLFMGQVHQP